MAENYYHNQYGSKQKRPSFLRLILRALLIVASIVASAALIFTLLAPYIKPSSGWLFPILGLLAPVTYLFNIALALLWIIRWRLWLAFGMVTILVVGAFKIPYFARMDSKNHYAEQRLRGSIKVMSYNVRHLFNDDGEWSKSEIARYIDSLSPDIITLQESQPKKMDLELSPKLQKYYKDHYKQLSIYSRYKIVKRSSDVRNEEAHADEVRSHWVDLLIGKDTVRVYNNHLYTTQINSKDDKYLTSRAFVGDSLAENKVKNMFERFTQSSAFRGDQVDSLSREIRSISHPVVVCGDFNDTPMSYTFQRMSSGLKDSFRECGFGYPYTYRGFLNLLRIDYILASEEFEFLNYRVDDDITYSDHLPIISTIKLKK